MKTKHVARLLILCLALAFTTAITQAAVLGDSKSAVVKPVPGTATVAAMHATIITVEGKLMPYEFYRHDTWSQQLVVPDNPRPRPEPAPI